MKPCVGLFPNMETNKFSALCVYVLCEKSQKESISYFMIKTISTFVST